MLLQTEMMEWNVERETNFSISLEISACFLNTAQIMNSWKDEKLNELMK